MVAPSSGRCGTFLVLVCLLLKSLPSDGQFTSTSSSIPPTGVRSSVNNHIHNRRFNIRAGESFTMLCDVQNPTQAFIAELYLDGRSIVITDGLLPNTTYSKTGTETSQIHLELTFDNFQAVHNGEYDCFANTTDGSTTNYVDGRLYGTGPITVTFLSSQYLIFYSDEDIIIPTQIRGEFYDILWYYHATDPLLASAGRETLDVSGAVTGVNNVRFSQELLITQGTTSHVAGYYAPEILDTAASTRFIMAGESVLVRAYASPTASLPAVENQSPGANVTVTCTATGYPEPTISFSTSDISASSSTGEHVTTTTATPSTVYTTTRSITFSGLLATDCGMVTCTSSNADRDGTQTVMATTPIQVIGSPDVSITPPADQAISIGGSLTLSCEAQDCTTTSFVYMWYRDGVNVENGTSLSISSASSSDFGRYECNATGDGGTGSAVTYISELNSLTLTSELSAPPNASLSTVEGSSVDHYNIESQATFSISCTFESPNDFDLEASKDGVVLTTDPASTSTLSSPSRTSKNLNIQLSSFSTSDNGVYLCNASNSDRNLLSRRVLLTTGALSAMRVSEEFIELVPPNSLQLEVSVDGAFSSLQWYRGSQQLMEGSGGVSFSDFSRSLTISNTSSSDAGQYQLIASDNTTNVSIIFEVQVFLEPNFTISTTPEVVVIEDSVNVTCSAQSFPEPFNLRLVFNGSNLAASSSSPAEFSESSRQFSAQTVYTIDSAQPDDHEGNYTCTVEVTRGSPSTTTTYTSAFFLDVNGPTAPNVTVDAMPGSVAVGDSGVLVCQASGGQPASYSFSWSNSTGDTVSSGVTASGSRSTLNITEAADADFDTYTCTVSSAYWNVSASGNFTELDLPLASLSLSNPDPVVLGASVGLDCSSVGRAPFNLSILVNGQVLASRNGAGRAEDLTYELQISDEANYTEYTCQAVNMFGSDNTTVTVVRATPPNVTAVSELVQTVTVDSGFTLQAEISGYNLPIDWVVWQRGSEALNSSSQFNISSDTGTLGSGSATLVVQSTASLVDDALYTLTVTNPAGNDTLVFNITIQIAPTAALRESSAPNVTVREYNSGSVVCDVTGTPSPTITWTFGGRTAMNGSEFTISRVDTLTAGNTEVMGTLTVLNASRGDLFSEIACQASNGIGADVNDSTQLLVEFAPNITFLSEEQTILASTSVSISCTVDTYPQSSISWYLDGQAVDSSRVTTVALGDGRTQNSTLSISSASTEDSGTYRCRANNSVSMDTMETQLIVEIAPTAALQESSSPNVTVSEYSSGSVVCDVTGTPSPTITWTFGGRTAMNGSEFTISRVDTLTAGNTEVMSTLTVLNASRGDLFSEIACQASNGIGADVNDSTTLLVEFAPNITFLSEEQTILANTSVSISCTVDTYPQSSISWYLDGQAVDSSRVTTVALGDGRTQNSTLSISSASTEDSGTYRCQASNNVSMDTMETQLTVEIAPLVLLEDLVVNETQTANLTCNVTGTPQASITWYLVSVDTGMSVELMTGMDYTISEEVSIAGDKNVQVVGVLSVLNAMKEDSGLYRCNATNTRGMDSSTANLTVQYAPRILNHSDDMVVVHTNNTNSLLCVTDALPDATVSWYFGDMMIVPAPMNGPGYQLISTSVNIGEEQFPLSILLIRPTDPDRRGTYTCVAENLVGRANESIVLEVQAPPTVSILESSQIEDQEQNATFTCLAVGVPAPDVAWQLDANRTGVVSNITADSMKYSIASMTRMRNDTQYEVRTVLTITDLTLNDTGLYICTGTNAAGADSDQQLLAVRFTPIIRNITGSQIIIAVSGADINCTVESFPEPKIEWLFNGKIISDDNNLTATVNNTRTAGTNLLTSTLNLFRTDPSSAGTYTCNATNALGTATADTDLVIHVRTTITFPERNNFTFVVNEGNNVTFECSAFGIPAPSLSWRRLSDNTTLSSNDSRVTIGDPVPMTVFQSEAAGSVEQVNRTLTLSMAADADSGSYECVAANMVGSGGQADTDRQEFQLYVRVAPVFLEVFNRTEVTYNNPLMLSCSATATPRPSITWYYEGTEVDAELSDTAVMENPVGERVLESTLMLNQPFIDMNGTYRCNASNVVSTISSEDEVEIFSQPFIRMAPGNVTVNQTDSASLVCTAQGNPLPTITWTGVSSDFTDSVSYDSNFTVTSTLSIASTTRSLHEGQYTCAAENGVEQVLTEEDNSASGIITVQVPPTVIPVEPMVIGINFMNATLSFTIQDASPEVVPVAIYWVFTDVNGTEVYNPIMGGEDFVFSADNLNLTLINVTNMFEGSYTLVASNAAGSNSATVEVIVEGPPRFIVTTERTQTVNGTDLTLSCYAVAEPLHTVTWFFTNASNVTVEIGSSNMTVAEGFTINNKTVPVMLGGEAEVMAAMPAQYGSLTIFNPQFSSRGLYSCRPENLYGSIETSTAVAVQVSPFILDTSPETEVPLDAASVVLNCTIRGFPLSNVVWNLNGRERPAQVSDIAVTTVRAQDLMPYSFHDGSSMNVVPVQDLEYFDAVSYLTFTRPVRRMDTGNYSCTGISQLGDSVINVTSDDVRLFILEVPDAPENVSISNSTDRGQLVTWDAPFTGNSPITSYKVFLSSSRDAAFVEIFSSSLRRKRQAGGGPSVAGVSDTSINVTNLIPFVTYQYMVSAINAIGTSNSSQPSSMVTTNPAAPDAPPTACVLSAVSSTAITATWTAPDPPNGVIADYTVTYRPVRAVADYDPSTFESMTNTNTGNSTPFLVAYGLQEAVEYMFEISAINQIGQGPAVTCSRLTNEDTPGEPRSLSGYSPSSTSVVVSWDHPLPQDQNGLIVNYTVLSQLNTEMNMTSTNGNLTMLTLSDLDIFTDYSISVMAHTSVGAGNVTQIVVVRTLNDTSSPPQCVTINSASNDTLTVSWYPPASPRGVVSDYIMRFVGSKAYDSAFNVSRDLMHQKCRRCTARPSCSRSGLNATCCWLTGLVPATNYTVDVAALNGAGEGERSDNVSMQTDVTIPPEIQEIPDLGSPSQTTLAIQIARCSNTNGPISHYQIIVVAVLPDSGFDVSRSPQDLYPDGYDYTGSAATVRESLSDSRPVIVYIAAEFAEGLLFDDSEMTKSYTLGSPGQPNDQRSMYTNGELRPGTQYTSFVKCFPDTTPSDLSDSRQYGMAGYSRFSPLVPTDPDNLVIIVVVVVILLLLIVAIVVICIVFICCCIVRKRNKDYYFEDNNRDSQLGFGSFGDRKDDMETGFNEDAPKKEIHLPIPVHQLGQAIEHLKRDENRGFQVEYQSIKDNSPQHSIDCFKIPENKPKNRYGNITCYDDTRVKLQETDDTGSDYINASYMNGYNREREYIASQGPLPITLGDFWKMIWEQDVYSIVMLTLVIEGTKIKCQQYWPKSDDATYGSFVVRVLDENVYATYTIRTLEVRMTDEKVTKEVKQFHFTSWPDFGVPLNAGPLLKFLRCVRSHHTYSNPKPMLMHCSAGVGRTGTLLALDVELQRAAMEKVVDPYNFVLHMRDQRNLMVQTESQYVFLYEAITEGLNRDYDEFPVTSLKDKMAENADFEEDTGQTGFEKEFKYLVGTSKVDTRQFSSANESVNSRKNRFLNFLPYNFSRVQLEQLPGLEGSDYINASFMDGYREKAAFIATQGPVPDTTADFWRMVWEKNSSCIVMLTQLMENNIEMCSEYWPKEGESVEYGPYEIKTVSERPMEDYVQREMEITDKTLEVHDKRTLTQFHFLSWPERGSPVSGAGMIDLIDQVRRVQMKTGNHPVVVHCSNGTGRTGAFISLTVAMEHVRTENLVDVFGTVKNLRTQRPHMIQTLEQYIFCYTTISEYVDSMDTYANYK